MIDLHRSKEIQIKRANTDWWIHEKAIVAENGKTYITAQNHNFAVVKDSLPEGADAFMLNANDKSVEAIRYGKNVLSCQFQPEFDKSELNTSFLFEQFKNEIC